MYADNTNLTYSAVDQTELFLAMNHDLVELKEWLNSNRLSLNVVKTKYMFIGTRHKTSSISKQNNISLDGHQIDNVVTYKCLGIHRDETLSWEAHISEVIGKVSKALAALRRLKPILPLRILISIYKSLILPHFDYCSSVWGSIGKGLALKLQKLQNRAARIITGSDWDVRSSQILADLNWPSLEVRRSNQFKTFMHKAMNKQVPEYIAEKLIMANTVHQYNLRGSEYNLFVPRPNTEALKRSFAYRGAVLWNSLTPEAKQANSLSVFRSHLTNDLI